MRTEAMTGHYNLSQRCAQLCSNVFEAAVAASGGFVLVKSTRRLMTDLVVEETAAKPAPTTETGGEALRRNHTVRSLG
ncbi:MAG TPA: hypothetical protein VKB38_10490 [Terracidiphilus sp.]|nr:hypothetical protein [Terracidiphilus sp.]